MSKRIIVDPITRIEGHLRIEVEMNGDTISDAYSSATLFRGIELILQGRAPEDAGLFAQRICGVCTYTHYETATWAIENALGIHPPKNARLARNILKGAQFVQDHLIHFYQLAGFDWVDIVSALSADPKKTMDLAYAYTNTPYNASLARFEEVKKRLKSFVSSGQLGPFANGYWGNPSYKLPPEGNLLIASHYLDNLDVLRIPAQIIAILGSKDPHSQTIIVGGISVVADLLNPQRMDDILFRTRKITDFINNAYIPDILLAAKYYKDEAIAGIGGGLKNYLAYGGFPLTDDENPNNYYLNRGVIFDRDLSKVHDVNEKNITEFVTHSWYKYPDEKVGLNPTIGITDPEYTGLNKDGSVKEKGKYSWLKAPRYENKPMEVGPLARTLVAYAKGNKQIKSLVDYVLKTSGMPVTALFSTLGRTAARAIEAKYLADALEPWTMELIKNMAIDQTTWTNYEMPNKEIVGIGLDAAPRGAVGHWVSIKNKIINHYQIVVPSTWNASPRDAFDQRGAYEESLIGVKLANLSQPLEILRTVHSFDPCIACGVHIIDPKTKEIKKYKIR
ncbi:MAG: nickel-dependent hydrogenase large subunit [bacterium]